jgi:hypothetical protein
MSCAYVEQMKHKSMNIVSICPRTVWSVYMRTNNEYQVILFERIE